MFVELRVQIFPHVFFCKPSLLCPQHQTGPQTSLFLFDGEYHPGQVKLKSGGLNFLVALASAVHQNHILMVFLKLTSKNNTHCSLCQPQLHIYGLLILSFLFECLFQTVVVGGVELQIVHKE